MDNKRDIVDFVLSTLVFIIEILFFTLGNGTPFEIVVVSFLGLIATRVIGMSLK